MIEPVSPVSAASARSASQPPPEAMDGNGPGVNLGDLFSTVGQDKWRHIVNAVGDNGLDFALQAHAVNEGSFLLAYVTFISEFGKKCVAAVNTLVNSA
jgi:hypothetical protein